MGSWIVNLCVKVVREVFLIILSRSYAKKYPLISIHVRCKLYIVKSYFKEYLLRS